MRRPARRLPWLALLALAACSESAPNAQFDTCNVSGYRCATPACAAFPTSPGCDDIPPVKGFCTVERPRCFDPTDAEHIKYYCDPKQGGVCITPKDPLPKPCPPLYCTMADVTVCNTTNADIFCRLPYMCIRVGAKCADGGVSDGGGLDGGGRD